MSILLAQKTNNFEIMITDSQSTFEDMKNKKTDVIKFRYVTTLGMIGGVGDPEVFIDFCYAMDYNKKTNIDMSSLVFNEIIDQKIKAIEDSEKKNINGQCLNAFKEIVKNTRISIITNDDNLCLLVYPNVIHRLPPYKAVIVPPFDYQNTNELKRLINNICYDDDVGNVIKNLINHYKVIHRESSLINNIASICYKQKGESTIYFQRVDINTICKIDISINDYYLYEHILTNYNGF